MIPKRFNKVARTVGELKELIKDLPDNLPVRCDMEDQVTMVVMNNTNLIDKDPHLEFMGVW